MQTRLVRVLVVDDFGLWRDLIRTMLQKKPELKVVGEASDGEEAVQKAGELEPDLILLDIALPSLNGIEAARRIRTLSPKSKIVFVTESYSLQIARQALNAGGYGYVVKSDAGSDLLTAVEAAILGKRFISARLAGQISEDTPHSEIFDGPRIKETLASFAPRLPRKRRARRRHEVQIYSDDSFLLDRITRFAGPALDAGGVVVAIATELHRNSFIEGLQARGLDIAGAVKKGRYRLLNVPDVMSAFMVNNAPDPLRYLGGLADLVESALSSAAAEYPRVTVFGELAVPLLAQGNVDAVIQIEKLSNEFSGEYELDILCAYPEKICGEAAADVLEKICSEHSTVYSQ